MNRRDFSRLSALTLAATRLPLLAQGSQPIRYAAVGLGTISEIFMRACAKSSQVKITALVTGHPDTKGAKYAAMYGIPQSSIYTYEQYDRLRDNKEVDAVYIGLPNSMHREYTVRAARAGKHVLCEKPMAISSAECQQMIDACRAAHVKLMIAYRCPQDPTHKEALRIVRSGALGRIQSFEGAFGFNAPPRETFWRLTKKYGGGGSIMDVGIYPLNAIRYFAGEEPVAFTATASTIDKTSGRFAEVEQSMAWTMRFPSGILASVASSYGANMPGFVRIQGDKGALELSPAFDYTGITLHGLRGSKAEAKSPDIDTTHFQLEAEHFANCIRTGAEPLTPGEEGKRDMVAIEAIYKAAGTPIA